MVEREWLKRPYDPATDSGLYYLLSIAYTRTLAGRNAGASRAGRTAANREPCPPDEVGAQLAFLEAHRPIWEWLLVNADVSLAVDRARPDTDIWGWLVTSRHDVVHACGVKRSVVSVSRELAQEVALDLIGTRWGEAQSVSLELPQFRACGPKFRGTDLLGITKPSKWTFDPSHLVTRMIAK